MILDVARHLLHEVDAEADGAALIERRLEIGRRGIGGVERPATVGILHQEFAAFDAQPDGHSRRHALASAVAQGVGEQLFEHEVQAEVGVVVEPVALRETAQPHGQRFDLPQVAVESQLRFVQNRRLWHIWDCPHRRFPTNCRVASR